MIGILIALSVSWLLLWLFYKKDLHVLGLRPTKSRLSNLSFGFLVSAICCAVYFLSIVAITKSNLTLNEKFTGQTFFTSTWWTLRSVLFEELIFRGALLYLAIQKMGTKIACILSAVAFGIYHWFSYGAFGNPIQMIYIFILTGIGGIMFAFAFAATKSMYLPIGLHFGWNIITIVVFSQGPLGQQLLISSEGQKLEGILSLVLLLFQALALPFITYWYLKRQKILALNKNA